MHINTRLSVQDTLRAYKELVKFFKTYPLALLLAILVYGLLAVVPDALFPIKMAAYAVAITMLTCVTTALYRTGDWSQILSELKFQQRLLLPALIMIIALSVTGFMVAEYLMPLLQTPSEAMPGTGGGTSSGEQTSVLMLATLAVGLICVAQIMPYVLAHFCLGLSLSKQQGERIWVALMLNGVILLAFSPFALAMPLLMILGVQAVEGIVLASALYCSFLLFIVFNIQKATPVGEQRFSAAQGSC
ncbi:hypothetical protein [Alteromonas halophila]|uniref:Uncharacterized protein n=1 Tax=Alteromonas halophila TaxID=516698 RepID=A0A918N153_9ALTE|nr:hypothetical protein [Alteromonas halophila]GGW92242.1 hypothetical protein GCM10007391_28210 [Alteromonas halophila]